MTHPSDLLPNWLSVLACVVFVAIAFAHLRHMTHTAGQRRPWHACHVLMAIGMALMYAPVAFNTAPLMSDLWQVVLAGAGVLAVFWALWGAAGAVNPVWLLTALDIGAMLFMWSGHTGRPTLSWVISGYLAADAGLWVLDAYRRFDGASSIIHWLPAVGYEANGSGAVSSVDADSGASLLGGLDISPSMVTMTLGMAYMLVATQLIR